jgi:predicted 3-demethylubiquinone-9 3-methyltransferase (glyoxalase superfamily)
LGQPVRGSGGRATRLKDRFGVSWQIVPSDFGEIMTSGDQAKIDRVTQAFLPMKKLDIATLMATAKKAEEPTP